MHIVLLDVDGTLTDTNHVDELCLTVAIETCLDISGLSRDWSTYEHSTDSGIVDKVIRRVYADPPHHQCREIERQYMSRLRSEFTVRPQYFLPMPGARMIMSDLLRKGYAVGIATGCWRDSATFKLHAAGIDHAEIPMSTANNHIDRQKSLMHGIEKCRDHYEIERIDSVTYIGDGVWDVQSAHAVYINFVGVGGERRRTRLIEAGANIVVESLEQVFPHLP
ncbi:MAG: HAD family hydrolase [Candidatus Kapabacteria bacterium]|nr:HAD family hydrolase [Candidatus Kapabacteria bacterium]